MNIIASMLGEMPDDSLMDAFARIIKISDYEYRD
jgi:hypothetical protein